MIKFFTGLMVSFLCATAYADQEAQDLCVQQFSSQCQTKCSEANGSNCTQNCQDDAVNQCRQAGE